ncbi:Methyltransferase domain-containing protein [Dyadobacter soli]|uniref:Methyltransferase domain-containing protein n=1 Tax=Dyadobacter soli TaxID=659014 RepID=A0A1G7VKX0_9BACT|nr:methyltransferase domain-containing protein [Dyadobacter soli]SDG60221.1 Methyltransferase domain-containing protein [Dyadobacter soli]
MTNSEAIGLIQFEVDNENPERWMDLGCCNGTFTTALATMLAPGSHIIGVDKQAQQFEKTIGNQVTVEFLQADFESISCDRFALDGILLANSLHYVRDKESLIKRLEKCFATHKRFLIVEYDTLSSNPWVPYPIDFISLRAMFSGLGYDAWKLGERPSLYGARKLYGAIATGER